MDSLTHIALGALIGQAYAGKVMGKRAMLVGAVYQSLPDIDIIAGLFLSPTENILFHRGISHSFLFAVLMSLVIAYCAHRWRRIDNFGLTHWMMFIGLEIFTHLLIDSLNAYGIGWLEPFSNQRFSFNVIFVIDPLFSVGLGISCIALLILRGSHPNRKFWASGALLLSFFYLGFCIKNKLSINQQVESSLKNQKISYEGYITTPTALNNLLWYCVAKSDSGYYIGYRSILDHSAGIHFTYFDRKQWLLNGLLQNSEVKNLLQFSNGYYTAEKLSDGLIFNDLRFGRIGGWEKTSTRFTFHYYLEKPTENLLVVQRGRFAEWNWVSLKSLVKRMGGD
ncbi:MAG: metal-dependent hydrolase [Chryseotalea sp. WA131a]|jgi:inner membrane protein|nr:MAG: metal-dependent hydrolase [Chryseotalea sp. WA131a]